MKGTKRIVEITRKANRHKLQRTERTSGRLNDFYRGRGDYLVRRNNIVLLSGSHARGTTAHIYIEDGYDILEVYGIVGGQPGWTEYYDWIHKGSWCDKIEQLMCELEKEIKDIEELEERKKIKLDESKQEQERKRLQKFECLFSS